MRRARVNDDRGDDVGVADDGAGVQALVVEIGGTTRLPDGSTRHVTPSLADGREAVEGNDVIRERGWAASKERHVSAWSPKCSPDGGERPHPDGLRGAPAQLPG